MKIIAGPGRGRHVLEKVDCLKDGECRSAGVWRTGRTDRSDRSDGSDHSDESDQI